MHQKNFGRDLSSHLQRLVLSLRSIHCVDFCKNFEIFLSLWLLNWPGGRVDGLEGVPGGLGWAVPDG